MVLLYAQQHCIIVKSRLKMTGSETLIAEDR